MLSEYGDILSGEQVRRILHISKRKCAWMLNNGFIKCKNTGKKSRKYIVLKADLIEFIEDSQEHPEKYMLPCGEFSSGCKAPKINGFNLGTGHFPFLPESFCQWLEQEFESIPDALTVSQLIATTGYTDNTINRWLREGHMKSVQTQNTKIIAKQWLIDFYCNYGHTITNMSDRHIALMQKFFKQTGGK